MELNQLPPYPFIRTARKASRLPRVGHWVMTICLGPFVALWEALFSPLNRNQRWAKGTVILLGLILAASLAIDLYLDRQEAVLGGILQHHSGYRTAISGTPFDEIINREAARNDLDPSLLAAVIEQESAFNPNAVSSAGAKGLMQIMPALWREYRPESTCDGRHAPPSQEEDCIFDPAANIAVGARHLAFLLVTFEGDVTLALAAYNAGLTAVMAKGSTVPNYPETRNFVDRILERWRASSEGWHLPPALILSLRRLHDYLRMASLTLCGILLIWLLR